MNDNDPELVNEAPAAAAMHENPKLVSLGIVAGWCCLLGSSVLLFLSTRELFDPSAGGTSNLSIILLTAARLCGIGGFVAGLYAIFNQRWTAGVLLLLCSIALPFVSLFAHGTM